LAPGLLLTAYDELSLASRQLYAPEGILASIIQRLDDPCESPSRNPIFQAQGEADDVAVQVAIGWRSGAGCCVDSFANLRKTVDGTHVDGLIAAANESFDRLIDYRDGGLSRRPRGLDNPVLRGMVATVAVRSRSATFWGAHRETLVSPEIADVVQRIVRDPLYGFLRAQPTLVRGMLARQEDAPFARHVGTEPRYRTRSGMR
jgi:DNA gyrase/topoisomerase IV subunit B